MHSNNPATSVSSASADQLRDQLVSSSPDKAEDLALSYIKSTPLEELGSVLEVMRQKIADYRLENNGRLPRPVFATVLGISGMYSCVEYVPRVIDEKGNLVGFLLKERGSEEQGWEGLFQIPGATITPEHIKMDG